MKYTTIRHNPTAPVLSKKPVPHLGDCGYNLPISSERVADAFASLPEQEQSILILRLVLDLTDGEIGEALGLSRSAVQRRRTKSLKVLRTKLTARKGG